MNHIHIRQFAFLFCIVFLLTLCGCQETRQFEVEDLDHLLLDDETVAYMESLYGLTREEAIEKLGLSDEDATIKEYWGNFVDTSWGAGSVRINGPTVTLEKEVIKTVKLDYRSTLFRAVVYTFNCNDLEETADIAEALYRAAEEKYSMGLDHGHIGGSEVLCSEGVFDEIRESGDHEIRKYIGERWSEAWVVGESSFLELTVWVAGENGNWAGREEKLSVELTYSILPEEMTRFDPEYAPRVSYRKAIRGDDDILFRPLGDG